KFFIIRKLGFGEYGDVFICKELESKNLYVMKKFKINNSIGNSEINLKIKKSFERELDIMKKLKHPNLTSLIGYEQSMDKLNLFMHLFDYSLKKLQELWLNRLPSELQELNRDPLDDRI